MNITIVTAVPTPAPSNSVLQIGLPIFIVLVVVVPTLVRLFVALCYKPKDHFETTIADLESGLVGADSIVSTNQRATVATTGSDEYVGDRIVIPVENDSLASLDMPLIDLERVNAIYAGTRCSTLAP